MQCHKNVTGSDLCKLPEHGTQKERPLKGDKTLKASNKICVSNAISILSIDVKKRKTTDYYSEILMMTLRDEEASNVKIKGLISQS